MTSRVVIPIHNERAELVAYANEEPPWFGSPWMGSAVHARSLKGQDVRGMICLEMIGYFTEMQPAPNALFRLAPADLVKMTGGRVIRVT